MASNTCKSCLRAFRRQSRSIGQSTKQLKSGRSFTVSTSHRIELPKPNATPANPIPPVTTKRAPLNQDSASESDPTQTKTPKPITQRANWSVAHPYTTYALTQILYKECSKLANYSIPSASDEDAEMPKTESGEDLGIVVDNSWWLSSSGAGLLPTFSTWSQVTMLHMWIFVVRFRALKGNANSGDKRSSKLLAREFQQHLLDHFFYDAEEKMVVNHNMVASGTRNKYLKDLHVQWRGCLAAYDEALIKEDPVLAAAIWRNVFKANEDVDLKKLAMIVSYARKALRNMGRLTDEAVTGRSIQFGSPAVEEAVVTARSSLMNAPAKDQNLGGFETKNKLKTAS